MEGTHMIGAETISLHNSIVSNSFPLLCNDVLHYRIVSNYFLGL